MSLSFGILGLLRYNDKTGYDLANLYKDSLSSFWRAQHSQIHRELNAMEEKGWVVSQVVIQEGKPNKRVFSITDSGREAFNEWIKEPANLYQSHNSPLLMQVFFGSAAPEEILRVLKNERDARIAALPAHIKKHQENINSYKATFKNGESESVYWQMILDYGVAQAEMMIKWTQNCIDKLEGELAKPKERPQNNYKEHPQNNYKEEIYHVIKKVTF